MPKYKQLQIRNDEISRLAHLFIDEVRRARPSATDSDVMNIVVAVASVVVSDLAWQEPDPTDYARQMGEILEKNTVRLLEKITTTQ